MTERRYPGGEGRRWETNKSSGSGRDGRINTTSQVGFFRLAHLCLEQVVLSALPVQRPRGHQRSLLIDAEGVALVPVHDGEGERRTVVRRVAVSYSELENARAGRSVLLWGEGGEES